MLSRKRVIKVALEDTSGTKVAGTAAVLAEDLEIKAASPFEARSGAGLVLGRTVPGILGERIGTCSFTVELRSSAGVTFTLAKAQYKELSLGDREGLQIYDAQCQLNNSSGNDWLINIRAQARPMAPLPTSTNTSRRPNRSEAGPAQAAATAVAAV
jgi:hypothetical protein